MTDKICQEDGCGHPAAKKIALCPQHAKDRNYRFLVCPECGSDGWTQECLAEFCGACAREQGRRVELRDLTRHFFAPRHWMQTYKGTQFNLDDPRAELVEVDDICVSLSRLARFNGHTTDFYSVAQHSVYVSLVVPDRLALPALMHDAAEAYIGDITRPVKAMLGADLHFLEKSILRVVAERFGFAEEKFDAPEIREADNRMLATERRDLMGPAPGDWGPLPEPIKAQIIPAPEGVAQQMFYKRYWQIMKWPDVRLGG